MSKSLKLCYLNEFRRIPIPSGALTIEWLTEKAELLFPSLKDSEIAFTWIDDDEDKIVFTTNDELKEAIAIHSKLHPMPSSSYDRVYGKAISFGIVKVSIEKESPLKQDSSDSSKKETETNQSVHTLVTCDECGMSPIVGVRYKCTVRNDFDLCENCEKQRIQPFPMLKVYTSEQLSTWASESSEPEVWGRRGHHHGRHHRGGGHGHGHGHGHGPFGHGPFGRGPFGGMGNPHQGPFGNGHPRGGCHGFPPFMRGGRGSCPFNESSNVPQDEKVTEACRTFVDAMDKAAESGKFAFVDESTVPTSNVNSDLMELERTLVEEALRMSVNDTQPVEVKLEKNNIENGSNSNVSTKLRSRFVRDVTYPDGTVVYAGTTFTKTWRIRNDGIDWPSTVTLAYLSGDRLVNELTEEEVPGIAKDQEVEVSMTLHAPELAGRYVTYFRLKNKDGSFFGQRFWADIRVVEEEEVNWLVVSGTLEAELYATTESSETTTPRETSVESSTESNIVEPTLAIPAEPVVVPSENREFVLVSDNNSSDSQANVSSVAVSLWTRIYETELKVLSEMGFSDVTENIRLLREHVGLPVSQNPNSRGIPNDVGMQKVVTELLTASLRL